MKEIVIDVLVDGTIRFIRSDKETNEKLLEIISNLAPDKKDEIEAFLNGSKQIDILVGDESLCGWFMTSGGRKRRPTYQEIIDRFMPGWTVIKNPNDLCRKQIQFIEITKNGSNKTVIVEDCKTVREQS